MSKSRVLLAVLATIVCSVSSRAQESFVSREEWGARNPRADISTYREYGLERPEYTRIILHVTSKGYGRGAAEMRRIQDFHMDMRGFSDIGYNYLVDSDGVVYEGRSLDVVPSHAGRSIEGDEAHDISLDPDYQSIGIVFSVETFDPLTDGQVDAAIGLIRFLKEAHPIDTIITHTEVRGLLESRGLTPQQDFDPNDCPGPGSIDQMVNIRKAVDSTFDEEAYRRLFRYHSTSVSME